MARLQEVLQRLRDAGLRLKLRKLGLKLRKCHFFQRKVKFLGHVIDSQGNHTDPDKHRLLPWMYMIFGFSWARHLTIGCSLKNYAEIANPLYGLNQKDAEFEWGENQKRAFLTLKKELTDQTCRLFRVDRTLTTPWRPQSDGMVERTHAEAVCEL